jgi:hypothetical protein
MGDDRGAMVGDDHDLEAVAESEVRYVEPGCGAGARAERRQEEQ